MTSKIQSKDKYDVKHAVCNLCKVATREKIRFNYFKNTIGFICKNCLNKFPKKDIELMYQLFNKYGWIKRRNNWGG